MNRRLQTVAATALLLAALPSLAAISATATLGVVSVTLIDLNPDDGITPSLDFTNGMSNAYAYAGDAYQGQTTNGLYQPLTSGAGSPTQTASATTGPQGGSVMLYSAGRSGSTSASVQSGAIYSAQFSVTPWTGVILQASFSGQSQTTLGRRGDQTEQATSQGLLTLSVEPTGDRDSWISHSAVRNLASYYTNAAPGSSEPWTGQTKSFTGMLSLDYANFSDATLQGTYYAQATVYGGSYIPAPVPEPASWALWIVGIAGMAAMRRAR